MSNVFPSLELNWNQDREQEQYGLDGGLTKRELFAAMAMQGWLAGCGNAYSEFTGPARFPEKAAEACVKFADALLIELEKPR